jgi:HD-GYP domain-containing protein (c-di-GMP phosphodiesterase class II)
VSKETKALSTNDLQLGMYVSKLDRPWLETPFLFQGFQIESAEVIEELRQYCKYVFVDTLRSEDPGTIVTRRPKFPRKPSRNGAAPTGQPSATSSGSIPTPTEPKPSDDTALIKAELGAARSVHVSTERVVKTLFDDLKKGETIELEAIEGAIDPMVDSILRNDDAMSWLARMKKKSDYVYDHSIASSVWALVFGKHLGLEKKELQVLGMGAVFLDVGKTKIPTELLTKRGNLSELETKTMRDHVAHGVEIVSTIPGIDPRVVDMVQNHHERHNGTGYPRGLSGNEIPIYARIAGIIDTYDAMTTRRPYAELQSTYDAMRQLNKLAGVEFPEEVVEQFVQAVGVFPVGTLVELNTGEVGIVIAQNRIRRLRPKIMLLLDRDKTPLETFGIVDLRNQLADASGDNSLWIEQGLAAGDYGLDPSEYYL